MSKDNPQNDPLVARTKALVIRFSVEAEFVPHDASGKTTSDAVNALGVPENNVIKCLILNKKNTDVYFGCVLNGANRLDVKSVQAFVQMGGLRFAKPEQIYNLTGHNVGGVPCVALHVCKETIIDSNVLSEEYVIGSGGTEFMGLKMAPSELLKIPGAIVSSISDAGD